MIQARIKAYPYVILEILMLEPIVGAGEDLSANDLLEPIMSAGKKLGKRALGRTSRSTQITLKERIMLGQRPLQRTLPGLLELITHPLTRG